MLSLLNFLAYAEQSDQSNSGLTLIVVSAGVILGVCFAGLLPIAVARKRDHQNAQTIINCTLLWAVLTSGAVIHQILRQMNWSQEYLRLIESGDFDPRTQSSILPQPWPIWGILIAVYVAIVVWSYRSRHRT